MSPDYQKHSLAGPDLQIGLDSHHAVVVRNIIIP